MDLWHIALSPNFNVLEINIKIKPCEKVVERKKNIFRGVREYMFMEKKTHLGKKMCFLYLSQFSKLYILLCLLRLLSGTT